MFQIQLRYFQYILSLAIFVGILISSMPLILSCFVGLTLVWATEMISGQIEINSSKYYVILVLLILSFSPILFQILFDNVEFYEAFVFFLIVLIIYFLYQSDINIYKTGNCIFISVVAFFVNSFVINQFTDENSNYIAYIYLLLLFLKTLATYYNVQFRNFQFFFNFFLLLIVFVGVSSFYDFKIVNVLIAGTSAALFTTFGTYVFTKLRFEYELTSKLSNQIYVFDYLLAFMLSMHLANTLKVVNGLF